MPNLIEHLNATKQLQYFDPIAHSDFAYLGEVNEILDNKANITNYFNENILEDISSLDNYIDYLCLKKIMSLADYLINIPVSKDKVKLESLIEVSKVHYNKIVKGQVIKFINNNYRELLEDNDDHKYFAVTYELCSNYQNGINNDVMLFLINSHSYKLFDDYDKWNKKIEKDEALYSALFSDNIIKENLDMRASIIYNVVSSLKDRNIPKIASIINHVIDLVIDYGTELYNTLNVDNVMLLQRKITGVSDFLKRLKHPKTNIFVEYEQKADDVLSEYLKEHGHIFKEEANISKIRDFLNSNQEDTLKLLSLTHSLKGDMSANGLLNNPPSDKKSIADLVSTNIKTDNYFTFTHQMNIEAYLGFGAATMNILISDEQLFAKSAQWYCLYINTIMEKCEYDSKELRDDFELLFQMLQNIFWGSDKDNQLLKSSLCYGGATFICAFSEKIMRIVYKQLKREIEYIPIEKITMGQLLSDGNPLYKEIFGENQLKHFRYFFISDGEKKIGLNLRNNLAHWSNMKPQQLNRDLVLKLMYLLTCIINSLFYHLAIKPLQKDNDNE